MILTTKGRYAVMAMVDLALSLRETEKQTVCLAQISERQEIPLAYLEQIFARLKRGALVKSVRGPGGGYRLGKPASAIAIAEIIEAAEESIKMTRCGSGPDGCMATKTQCLTHDLWEGLGQQIQQYLGHVSLEDVCAKRLRERLGMLTYKQTEAALH